MDRVISVTRRHVEFLGQSAVVERVIARRWLGGPVEDTELQLPTADDDKTGEDVG